MTAPGSDDPIIAYQVHRGALIVIVITMTLLTGYLVFHDAPGMREWVISAIEAVRDKWTSWHWNLL